MVSQFFDDINYLIDKIKIILNIRKIKAMCL